MSSKAQGRILVVDDTDAIRYSTSRILRRAGFETVEATTGREALETLTSENPDLIILDVNLPDMSGYDVCHIIKADPAIGGIPVLQVSATSIDTGSKVTGLDAGADAYLTHPVPDEELVATVNALLRIRRAEEEARHKAQEAQSARDELQKVLAALREKNQALEALIQACPLAIMAVDGEGKIRTWNPAAELVFGWRQHEVLGRTPSIVVPGVDNASPEQLTLGGEDLRIFETVCETKTGRRIPVSISAAPLYGSDGVLQGSMVLLSDETAHKLADEALRRHEQLVASGRMAAALAHEINNPLSAVLNLLYIMRQYPGLDASMTDHLKVADEQLGRVAQITKQVLSLHRTTRGTTEFRLSEIVEASLSLYTLQARERQIHIRREYEPEALVISSPGDLRQIFSNLIGNAIDVLGTGGTLVVRARQLRVRGRKGLRITVADNGPGIAAEIRTHIFEPFFTSKGEKGTGLGLWIVNSIVHKHRGSIRVRSCTEGPRHGTCFSVFLPNGAATGPSHNPI